MKETKGTAMDTQCVTFCGKKQAAFVVKSKEDHVLMVTVCPKHE